MSESLFSDLWRPTRLEDIAVMVGGGTPSRKNATYFAGSIPWLTSQDLPEDTVGLIEQGREYITTEAIQESATNKVPAETVLITTRVNVGKVAVAQTELCFSQDVTGIVLNEKRIADPEYVGFFLMLSRDDLLRRNRGTTITGITRDDLRRIQIPLPPLREQRHIVEILRKADKLRQLRRDAQEETQALLPALFEEMFGDPLNNSKGWVEVPLSQHIKFITSGSRGWAKHYASDGGKFIRVQNLSHHKLDTNDMAYVRPPDSIETERAKIQAGDILFSITGVVGLVVVAPNNLGEAYVSQHVAIVRVDEEVNPVFVAAFLAHNMGGQERIRRMQYGQTKPGFGLENIRSLKIPLPPKGLQDEYALQAQKATSINSDLIQSEKEIEDLFSSLLPRAFRGELTSKWRERLREELVVAAVERDKLLAERGTSRATMAAGALQLEEAGNTVIATGTMRHTREELLVSMSLEQHQIWEAAIKADGYLNAEMINLPPGLSLARTRQTLELLAAAGLLMRVSLWNPEIGNFVPAYRLLRAADEENNERGDEAYDDDVALLEKR